MCSDSVKTICDIPCLLVSWATHQPVGARAFVHRRFLPVGLQSLSVSIFNTIKGPEEGPFEGALGVI